MLKITVTVNASTENIIGIKEDIALYLERYGDVKVVSVEQVGQPKKYSMNDYR